MRITYDAKKRALTLLTWARFRRRGDRLRRRDRRVEDIRRDYGERRIICCGVLYGRMVVVGYTPRGPVRHIFSMRKANDREQARLAPYLEVRSGSR